MLFKGSIHLFSCEHFFGFPSLFKKLQLQPGKHFSSNSRRSPKIEKLPMKAQDVDCGTSIETLGVKRKNVIRSKRIEHQQNEKNQKKQKKKHVYSGFIFVTCAILA